jgi:hypothetical protein
MINEIKFSNLKTLFILEKNYFSKNYLIKYFTQILIQLGYYKTQKS